MGDRDARKPHVRHVRLQLFPGVRTRRARAGPGEPVSLSASAAWQRVARSSAIRRSLELILTLPSPRHHVAEDDVSNWAKDLSLSASRSEGFGELVPIDGCDDRGFAVPRAHFLSFLI